MDTPQTRLIALIAAWRARAVVVDGPTTYVNHAFSQCADELAAALVDVPAPQPICDTCGGALDVGDEYLCVKCEDGVSLGQAWVSRITNASGDEVSVIGAKNDEDSPTRIEPSTPLGPGDPAPTRPGDHASKESPKVTLRDLAFQLGWGGQMTDIEIYNFLFRREQLLRMAMSELETHKSNASTAEQAVRERVNVLKSAALSPVPSPWQPIETAPKDTDVLVFAVDGYPKIGTASFTTYADKGGGWWQWDWEYETREIQPSHWMPLPSPPSQPAAALPIAPQDKTP